MQPKSVISNEFHVYICSAIFRSNNIPLSKEINQLNLMRQLMKIKGEKRNKII